MQPKEHIDGNGLGDKRILLIALNPRGIVRQEAGLDVAVDEEVAAKRSY